MSIRRHATITLGVVLAALVGARLVAAEGAHISFDTSTIEKQAKNTVNVTITPQTIEWALAAMGEKGQDTAEARQLLKGIDQVMVRVLEFEEPRPWEDLAKVSDPILSQLKGSGWTPVVSVSETKKDGGRTTVNVSLYTDPAGKPGGLAVLVVEPKELVIVNIAGAVDLARLSQVMKVLNLPQMPGISLGAQIPGVAAAHGPRGKMKEKDKDKEKSKGKDAK
jgi:hypothetical protein